MKKTDSNLLSFFFINILVMKLKEIMSQKSIESNYFSFLFIYISDFQGYNILYIEEK